MSHGEQLSLSEDEATEAEGAGVGGGEEEGPVPELSALAVFREALEDARRRSRPKQHHEGGSRRRPSGPFVLQLLRASPDSEAYALSDGQYYWYEKEVLIGTGGYGRVWRARVRATGEHVALKKVLKRRGIVGIDSAALRESKALMELRHPNVVALRDAFVRKESIYLAFELCCGDLERIISDRSLVLSPAVVKSYARMLLSAVAYCHANWFLHRDIKPGNLLVAADGTLRLTDFGLAREHGTSPDAQYSPRAITLWYRPPELLLGSRVYGEAADIWSCGCVIAQLLLRRPYFACEREEGAGGETGQLSLIYSALGCPDERSWPGVTSLPGYFSTPDKGTPMKMVFTAATDDTLDLLGKLLALPPAQRVSARTALEHEYFRNAPAPAVPPDLPLVAPSNKRPAAEGPADDRDTRRPRIAVDDTARRNLANMFADG
eukprot:m51a1_g1924 putative CDK family protein kinase (435) ;mRNA; f:867662-873218